MNLIILLLHYDHLFIVEHVACFYDLSVLLLVSRFQGTLDRLAAKLESVYTASGGRKINIISHSMGGLLMKCFMSLRADVMLFLCSWIALFSIFLVFDFLWQVFVLDFIITSCSSLLQNLELNNDGIVFLDLREICKKLDCNSSTISRYEVALWIFTCYIESMSSVFK